MRNKSGFSKKFYPRYELYVSGTHRFIMAAQKMQIMRSAHYSITVDPKVMDKKAPGYLGKLRSNLMGTEFNMFSQGENPASGVPQEQVRAQHGAVVYVIQPDRVDNTQHRIRRSSVRGAHERCPC